MMLRKSLALLIFELVIIVKDPQKITLGEN
jgi:hypothetical protein